ncbi:phosphatase PAP2 family protein [Protofrankia symbiont of Coriaria ruscifolia]|uniref:phosphatase PAP2 family protein n=1 Tax=Protofrankia symbiont of Coriaria ruscifolia TaxID=1306542 RepID=UPI0010416A58|nr:phosphatase PAP2 family protein [Protofrankia symbiont of Coriaria ruscifolia]
MSQHLQHPPPRSAVSPPIPLVSPIPLLPPLLRQRLWALIVLPCLLVLGVLSWELAGRRGPSYIDGVIDPRLVHRFGRQWQLFQTVIQLGNPGNVALASVALAGLCVALRVHRAALLSLSGPPSAGALTQWVLKPLIDRRLSGGLAFPSGHTTGACAVAAVLVLLLLPGAALRWRLPGFVRILLWYVAAVFGAGVGLGVIVLRYHYATDVIGGVLVAVMVIGVLAWMLDRQADRYRPALRTRPMVVP